MPAIDETPSLDILNKFFTQYNSFVFYFATVIYFGRNYSNYNNTTAMDYL